MAGAGADLHGGAAGRKRLWNMLAGQGCFKITAETGEGLTGRLSALQTAEGVELGAFSMKNLQTGTLAPATLYESVLFHPMALGLSMTEGDMPFRTGAEDKILLHTKTAARLIPTGQCVGETVKIEAGQFQVAGLYKGTGLWKNEASAVVSAGESGLRPVYVWMRTASDDVFAYERLRRALTEENQGTDAGQLRRGRPDQAGSQRPDCQRRGAVPYGADAGETFLARSGRDASEIYSDGSGKFSEALFLWRGYPLHLALCSVSGRLAALRGRADCRGASAAAGLFPGRCGSAGTAVEPSGLGRLFRPGERGYSKHV